LTHPEHGPPRDDAGRTVGGWIRIGISALIAAALVVWVYRAWPSPEPAFGKIGFDMSQLDEDGLYGPEDGKRARMYEFCIPDTPTAITEVRAIDGTVELSAARGRIGCTQGQLLAIGSTAQPEWLDVLTRLAGLDYVDRIEPYWGE